MELWRAGGLREGEELAFPVAVSPGPDHRAAIPDFRLGQVMVVGPDGTWEGSWTRQGEGPGEILRPVAASWTAEGQLVAFDIEGARVVWLDSAETASRTAALDPGFTGPVVASGSIQWAAVTSDGRAYLRPGISAVPSEARGVTVVTTSHPEAGGSDTLAVDTLTTLEVGGRFARLPIPGVPWVTSAVRPDGTLLLGARDGTYRIFRAPAVGGGGADGGSTGGGETVVVCRGVAARPLSDRERGRGDIPEGREALAEAIRESPAPERLAPFGRFFIGRDGRIWVQRDRSEPFAGPTIWGVPGATYDVFEPDGRYLGSVEAPEGARLQAASGDTIWALEFGELDQASVVAYGLRLRPE